MPDIISVDDLAGFERERLDRRAREAWTCTACEQTCELVLVSELNRFLSKCCTASVLPTRQH